MRIVDEWPTSQEQILISPEDVLQKAILISLEITPADIEEYESRPQAMVTSSLMMQAANVSPGGNHKLVGFII